MKKRITAILTLAIMLISSLSVTVSAAEPIFLLEDDFVASSEYFTAGQQVCIKVTNHSTTMDSLPNVTTSKRYVISVNDSSNNVIYHNFDSGWFFKKTGWLLGPNQAKDVTITIPSNDHYTIVVRCIDIYSDVHAYCTINAYTLN